MSVLVECPHCSTRVLPMAGRLCPSCRKNVDAPPDPAPKPSPLSEVAFGVAVEQVRQGVAPEEVEAGLTGRGLDAMTAAAVVRNLEQARAEAKKAAAAKIMVSGAAWCVGGFAVTVWSFRVAANSGGGSVWVAWGAIVFGGVQFFRGLIRLTMS